MIDRAIERLAAFAARSGFLRRRLELLAKADREKRLGGRIGFSALSVVISLACLCAMLWFLAVRIGSYMEWPPADNANPAVFNLTSGNVKWDVYYGHSPKCGSIDCYLTPDFPAERFTKHMVLPAREFPLSDYKRGELIYLRTTFAVPKALLATNDAISLSTLYVWAKHYDFYVGGVLLDEGAEGPLSVTLPRSLIGADGRVFIAMRIDPGTLAYQGLANRADLLVGPRALMRDFLYKPQELKTTFFLWFLLPKITFCIVFIFLFLAVHRNTEIFSFIIFAFLSCVEAFARSSYAPSMLPLPVNWELIGMTSRNAALLVFFLFVNDLFRRRQHHAARMFAVALGILLSATALCAWLLPYKIAYSVIDVSGAVLRPAGLIYAAYCALLTMVYLQKTKLSPSRARVSFMLLLFFVFSLGFALDNSAFLIADIFGLNQAHTWNSARVWVVDLVFFMILSGITAMEFGVTIAAKNRAERELHTMEERLELGRSVQQLLMPRELSGTFAAFNYSFHHEAAEKMAGDWLSIWEVSQSERRLLMGDVVGKGPQAALAVSVIVAVISECRRAQCSLEDCIRRINVRLVDLFQGYINTTVSAVALHENGQVDLYNCGGAGWLLTSSGTTKFFPVRGSLLGTSESPRIGHQRLEGVDAGALATFTDGCIEGSRAIKALVRTLNDDIGASADLGRLKRHFWQAVDKAADDDRTLLLVQLPSNSKKPHAA